MKNLKKISREQLKQVKGAGPDLPACPVGYFWKCEANGVCDETFDEWNCFCGCYPVEIILPNPR
ncbi:bacteriocin-like protein [Chryseobacterium takakiae]|uniref:Bacteriocin-type signal sequence-containing protein n=1 Tax=Chryseobacterium takakiae TaxID=1302685 RepID=A0A1M5A6B9_9FLAO|nr:hypothetical protein [Chryseobacterium takakiae]SHF25715.1 hypothetical protein SAMN05444408_11211 [Chryseobacterium takakiae]